MDLLDENKDETAPEISDEISDGDAFSESSQSLRYKTNERILPARFTTGSESGHTPPLNNTFSTYQYPPEGGFQPFPLAPPASPPFHVDSSSFQYVFVLLAALIRGGVWRCSVGDNR